MATTPAKRTSNENQWQEHLRKAHLHPGGVSAYCREAGLARSTASYWHAKFSERRVDRSPTQNPAFISVQVLEPADDTPSSQLPDAKWVAEILHHLANKNVRRAR